MKTLVLHWKATRVALYATAAAGIAFGSAWAQPKTPSATAAYPVDRTVLPIAEPKYPLSSDLDARKATPPKRFEVKAPQGAPNVVIFLIDDIGFGHASTFGGAIPMPTLEGLASQG